MITLRQYQSDSIQAVFKMWSDGESDALIIAPCGAGKSLIIADTVRQCLEYSGTRVLILTHRKELLTQNSAELRELLPDAPLGFWSSGLKKKDINAQVLFAGIASIANHIYKFDPFQVVIIDESHLVASHKEETQYAKVLAALNLLNPCVRFMHLTATPYRLDSGHLPVPVAYEIGVQFLIDNGFLLPLVSKSGVKTARADMSKVHHRGGEFIASEMQAAFCEQDLIDSACDEVVHYGEDRRSWVIFCAGVDHAHQVADAMQLRCVDCAVITGETPADEREQKLTQHKNGELKCLINCDVLTTGWNSPITDLIAMMRATESASMYVQIAGRGQRIYPGKNDCLFLDYGGNVARLGFVDAPIIKTPGSGGGEAPVKECPQCMSLIAAGFRECPDCGFVFPAIEIKHENKAYTGAILKSQVNPEWVDVDQMTWTIHKKEGKPDSIRVRYDCGFSMFTEFLCVEHEGFAGRKGRAAVMSGFLPPSHYFGQNDYIETIAKADTLHACYIMANQPRRIFVEPEGKYYRVIRHEW